MRKHTLLLIMALLILPVFVFQNTGFATADELPLSNWITEAENILREQTSASVLSMTIKKKEYDRDFDLLLLTDDRAGNEKVMVRMLGPALWRGNVTLKVNDKITFYEPRNKRTTVMGSSMLTDNWMGSHFTNDDLMRETDLAIHYSYAVKDQWQEDAKQHHVLILTPKPTSPVAWGKVEYHLYVDDEQKVFPVEVSYFKRVDDQQEIRKLSYQDIREMGGKIVPTRLTMQVFDKPGEYTEMVYQKIRFNADLPTSKFTEQAFN